MNDALNRYCKLTSASKGAILAAWSFQLSLFQHDPCLQPARTNTPNFQFDPLLKPVCMHSLSVCLSVCLSLSLCLSVCLSLSALWKQYWLMESLDLPRRQRRGSKSDGYTDVSVTSRSNSANGEAYNSNDTSLVTPGQMQLEVFLQNTTIKNDERGGTRSQSDNRTTQFPV